MGKNVLLVEDDHISRESLAKLLLAAGHILCAVWSAEEAKHALKKFTPDIALLDIHLPGLAGDAFALYLRRLVPTIKIIFLSSAFHLDEPERFGPNVQFLPKPLDFPTLLTAIQ